MSDILVNQTILNDQQDPNIIATSNGEYWVVWVDDSNSDTFIGALIRAQIHAADGSVIKSEFVVNQNDLDNQFAPDLCRLENGNIVLTWSSFEQMGSDLSDSAVKAIIYDPQGNVVVNEFLVNTSALGAQWKPQATGLSDGGFVITYETSDTTFDDGIFAQVFESSGAKRGSEIEVESYVGWQANNPTVTSTSDGKFIVTYETNSVFNTGQKFNGTFISDSDDFAVIAKVFNNDGTKIEKLLVNEKTAGGQFGARSTTLADGSVVIVWTSGDPTINGIPFAIAGMRLDSDGNKLGPEFRINTTGSDHQLAPDIAALPDGGFVVTWLDNSASSGSETDFDIKAQIFNEDGHATGPEISVNTTTSGMQTFARVAALENGRFVIVWEDESATGDDTDGAAIKSKIYTSDGVEILGNTEPVANNDLITTTDKKEVLISIADLLANDMDPDKDLFTFQSFSAPSNGTLTRVNENTLKFVPSTGAVGSFSFTYTVSDGIDTTTASATINIQNNNPTVTSKTSVTDENTNLVLSSAFFLEGATDPDGDTLELIEVNNAVNGTVSLQNGTVTFVPTEGFLGTASFDYVVGDGYGGTKSGQAEIAVLPPAFNLELTSNVDDFIGTDRDDFINALAGDDIIDGLGGDDSIKGGEGDDSLLGGDGNDLIAASDGNDTVDGGSGNDNIGGGLGDDVIRGSDGNDTIGSGKGNDNVEGGAGDDLVSAGHGDDTINGGDGDDRLAGSVGADSILGATGHDNIGGGYHNDTIQGGSGDDTVGAGQQDDLVYGNSGNDVLNGNWGHDTIFGGAGDDTISGGDHNDVMTGGDGADVFKFRVFDQGTEDRITDFTHGEDILEMKGNFEGLTITNHADGIQIEKNGHVIVLEGVETLTEDNFNFV